MLIATIIVLSQINLVMMIDDGDDSQQLCVVMSIVNKVQCLSPFVARKLGQCKESLSKKIQRDDSLTRPDKEIRGALAKYFILT